MHKQEKEYGVLVQSIEGIEKARIELGKLLIVKHYKCVSQLAKLLIEKSQPLESSIHKTNSKVTLQPLFKLSENPFLPLSCVVYTAKSCSNSQNRKTGDLLEDFDFDYTGSSDVVESTVDTNANASALLSDDSQLNIVEAFTKIKNNKGLAVEERTSIMSLLNSSEPRSEFIELLTKFTKHPIQLKEEAYYSLSSCCYRLLTAYMNSKELDAYALNVLLAASRQVSLSTEGEREFLYAQIVQHDIWQSMSTWRAVIQFAIENRIAYNKEVGGKKSEKSRDKNKFRDIFNKMKGAVAGGVAKIWQTKDTEEAISGDSAVWRGALYILNLFCYYLSTPYINLKQILKLYQELGKQYNMPKDKLSELKQELAKCQNELKDKPASKCVRKLKQRKKYIDPALHILAMAIKFIENKAVLRNMLILNKHASRVLRLKVYRQILVRLDVKLSLKERLQIWGRVLDIVSFA
eukprot:TRINITY_DN1428_c0_g2_i1.p1 TRINITY_DN1428_c0_g2~~TRINITY_DN1428_c0_g2_i1.p1  ORF type:complete len:463 (+),score=71.75 TRINITY_DN1428_c0_g2_i1:698-2086(+)